MCKKITCELDIVSGYLKMIHVTFSLQGGLVREPSYVQ